MYPPFRGWLGSFLSPCGERKFDRTMGITSLSISPPAPDLHANPSQMVGNGGWRMINTEEGYP
jgi:hypothetical protein